jgi:hypothetical protein
LRTVEVVIDDAELVASVAQRPHWQLDDRGATYAPPGATAHVQVRPVKAPARARERYVATTIAGTAATSSTHTGTALEAITWAERRNLA